MSNSPSASRDPLLQPYQLKHLTLKNRIMTTAHEPGYPEDGMPKGRYRAYHVERAKAGVALAISAFCLIPLSLTIIDTKILEKFRWKKFRNI